MLSNHDPVERSNCSMSIFCRSLGSALVAGLSLAALNACSDAGGAGDAGAGPSEDVAEQSEALVTDEDGLADAYQLFKTQVTRLGFDKVFPVGYGYHPGLATQKVLDSHGFTPRGQARITFAVRDANG